MKIVDIEFPEVSVTHRVRNVNFTGFLFQMMYQLNVLFYTHNHFYPGDCDSDKDCKGDLICGKQECIDMNFSEDVFLQLWISSWTWTYGRPGGTGGATEACPG